MLLFYEFCRSIRCLAKAKQYCQAVPLYGLLFLLCLWLSFSDVILLSVRDYDSPFCGDSV